jgi:putative ABC transport system substrate-binding protein
VDVIETAFGGATMKTLALATILVLSLLGAPFATEGQQSQRPVPRVGYLGVAPRAPDDAFRRGLRELGYVEGTSIVLEYRWADNDNEAAERFARELLQLNVDLIVTIE